MYHLQVYFFFYVKKKLHGVKKKKKLFLKDKNYWVKFFFIDSLQLLNISPISQTRLKPSPRLKSKSKRFQLKANLHWLIIKYISAFLSQETHVYKNDFKLNYGLILA